MLGVRRRLALVVAAALLGSAALGVWSAAREAHALAEGRAAIAGFFPDYPGAVWLDMGGAVHVEGQPRRLGYFVTPDSPRQAADRFAGTFRAQGYRVEEHAVGDELWVTASLAGEPLLRTLVATPRPQGALVVGSVTEPLAERRPQRVPLPPTCAVLSRTGGRDRSLTTELVLAHCQGEAAPIATFYDERLGHGTALPSAAGVLARVYRREGSELVFTATQEGAATLLTVSAQEER